MAFEIKMQHATEKILAASTESQRPAVMGQLEASGKRIQMLQLEVTAYTKAVQELAEPGDGDVKSYKTDE